MARLGKRFVGQTQYRDYVILLLNVAPLAFRRRTTW
ncbi:hypothetical protein CASFOL_002045 [Castilleja foliolosa]|uniref:Uncharacterized protein n=1 Tax=Castilleja foliolosa TaxID=1961234 RepID=A0ABD3EDS3_9LAMI